MKFQVYRPAGEAKWVDDEGRRWVGFETIKPVGIIEAADFQQAFAQAKSWRDPAPILEPVA
jgi:hypothetical protein